MEENSQQPNSSTVCPVVEAAKELEAKVEVDVALLNETTTKLQKELEAKLLALEGLVKSVEVRATTLTQTVHSKVQALENFLKTKYPFDLK